MPIPDLLQPTARGAEEPVIAAAAPPLPAPKAK
jgi:hypothetical protein